MHSDYRLTRLACYIGYITQAITINLTTLFFVIFQERYSVRFALLGQIVFITFVIQILVDLVSIRLVPRIGYRAAAVTAHVSAALGLILLGILPRVLPDPYAGILIAVFFYSIGGGLTEVIISPLIDALPGDAKASSMSLLHSFYSWGFCLVVLVTTPLLSLVGQQRWYLLPFLWALIPILNTVLFLRVPLPEETQQKEKRPPLTALWHCGAFYVFILLMICSGASEQAMSQWASLFAEKALGLTKALGDILGPCLFAVFMALGRTGYGLLGKKIRMAPALTLCAILTFGCYMLTVFGQSPLYALIGCAVCGFGVSLMWPGVLSLSSARFPRGGTPMFAVLALAGDLGCSFGPWISGLVSDAAAADPSVTLPGLAGEAQQTALKTGMFAAAVFPLLMVCLLVLFAAASRRSAANLPSDPEEK